MKRKIKILAFMSGKQEADSIKPEKDGSKHQARTLPLM